MTVTQGYLPLELTGLVGRRSEIAEVRRLLSRSRVVTLTGLGGVGKTRLALRVAEEVRRSFPGGTWFVDLSELSEPALVDQTVVHALRIQDRSARPSRAVLIEHLDRGRTLLVLDNCEHLVVAVAGLVAESTRGCPDLCVLATSREPLEVSGEVVLRVPPLGVPPDPTVGGAGAGGQLTAAPDGGAMELFEQRAHAAAPDFAITDRNRTAVQQIVRRLEGLPLPIELAATRLRVMSADEVLRRLNDRFRLLTRGSRNAPSRQQTLRLSIDWSHALCSKPEQRLWARLAVFAGSFDLEAAEGVLGEDAADEDLLDLISSLVDKPVLIGEGQGPTVRYRMLETLRDYGRGRLSDAEWAALRLRHRRWYLRLVLRARDEWIGPRQHDWAVRLDREQPNVRAALETALGEQLPVEDALRAAGALHEYWIIRGKFGEGRYWLDRMLGGDGGSAPARLDAVAADALLAALQRDVAAGSALAAEARRLADEMQDPAATALADFAEGVVTVTEGDLARGIAQLERAVDRFRASSDLGKLVPALYWLGCTIYIAGDLERASTVYEEQLELTAPRGGTMWRAMSMSDYGSALWRRGRRGRGVALLEEALRLLRLLDNRFGCAWCFEELAWARVDDDPELAAFLMGAADAQFTATGSPMATFESLVTCHDACVDQARDALGGKRFTAELDRGRTTPLEEAIERALHERPRGEPPAPEGGVRLTRREWQVAELVAQGMTNKAIAERLVLSRRTIDGHVEHIRDKLGFASRVQIVAWVLQHTAGPGDGADG
ncbi:ATP-binding protein [Speluncibacter jeojiensis]|uniref:LuxR C-terminal-related transcriptional regulator n=1 Tax=Speluncibacter jeojiensis TaxID=2710754 RepID=A0A9X4LYK9_9ACTN|nr:LuxR C-terminal-related transcriptional regulator [Corynebacteriales bacterium D3-21]